MKYFALLALFASVEARHHHHHSMMQVSTPDQSRAAWSETRDQSRAVAAEQERFQKEHNAMVAKNYADDTLETNTKKWHDAASRINMMNGGTTPFRTVTNARLDTKYVYIPEEEMYISLVGDDKKEEAAAEPAKEEPKKLDMDNSEGPKDAATIKAASLKKSLEVVAGQQAFEAAHGSNH